MKIERKVVGREGESMEESGESLDSIAGIHSKLIQLGVCKSKCDGGVAAEDSSRRQILVVDGGTLLYALDPSLKKLFLNVAKNFHSVLCCRATPLQKVRGERERERERETLSFFVGWCCGSDQVWARPDDPGHW